MSVVVRDEQRDVFCRALASVPADAPTLCAGWTAYDLAVHVWILKHDPVAWPADLLPPLAPLARRRAERVRRRFGYRELVEVLAREPAAIACMPDDRFEGYRHSLGEYFMHTQDVARPNGLPQSALATPPGRALDHALWLRVQRAAPALHWRTRGLVLATPDGRLARVTRGRVTRVVTGPPSELMMWAYGRHGARVRVHG